MARIAGLAIALTTVVDHRALTVELPRWEPVAVAGIGADRIAVLGRTGALEIVTAGVRKTLTQFRASTVLDLTGVAGDGGAYTLLVSTVHRTSGGDVIGTLEAIPSKQSVRTSGTIYSGVALKPGSPTAGFAANARTREIYTLTFSGDRLTTKYLAAIPDPSAILGALALDAQARRLYVADLTGGNIWMLPTTGGDPVLFATGLRDVRALAADDRWVFAADGDGRRIVQFAQQPGAHAPRQTASSARRLAPAELKSPSAVTVLQNGRIAVGDSVAGAVFIIGMADGRVAQAIH